MYYLKKRVKQSFKKVFIYDLLIQTSQFLKNWKPSKKALDFHKEEAPSQSLFQNGFILGQPAEAIFRNSKTSIKTHHCFLAIYRTTCPIPNWSC